MSFCHENWRNIFNVKQMLRILGPLKKTLKIGGSHMAATSAVGSYCATGIESHFDPLNLFFF